MSLPEEIQREIERRAAGRCEYCRMHQALQGATFHAEHIVPRRRGGNSSLENLALACPGCNLHKSDRVEFADPIDGTLVHLFHPRLDRWADHFRWDQIQNITPHRGWTRHHSRASPQ